MGQVPTLVIEKGNGDSLVLTQSLPIIEYLDEGPAQLISYKNSVLYGMLN